MAIWDCPLERAVGGMHRIVAPRWALTDMIDSHLLQEHPEYLAGSEEQRGAVVEEGMQRP